MREADRRGAGGRQPRSVRLLLYGLQRSGTNYLETLLRRHFRVRLLNCDGDRRSPMQKHFRLYAEKHVVPEPRYRNDVMVRDFEHFEQLLDATPDFYVVVSKDPYSWLLSYSDWAKACDWPEPSHNYLDEYGLFYRKWLEFSEQSQRIVFVRYPDLLQNPRRELARLQATMSLPRRLLSRLRSNLVRKVPQSSRFSKGRRDYYLQEGFLDRYRSGELETMNRLMDIETVSRLGYEVRVST